MQSMTVSLRIGGIANDMPTTLIDQLETEFN